MFQYMHYLFNETEIRFYKKYKLFPDELFQQLQNLGFSRQSFQPIQKEMDRLFLQTLTIKTIHISFLEIRRLRMDLIQSITVRRQLN